MPDLPKAENITVPQIWQHSLGSTSSDLVSGLLHLTTSSMKASSFLEKILIPVMDLPFLHIMLLLKFPYVDLQNSLSIIMEFSVASDQKANFTIREVWQLDPGSWSSLVLPCHLPSWSSCSNRKIKWYFEDTIMAPIRWQQPGRLGQASLKCSIGFESMSNIWYVFFSTASIYMFRNQRIEKEIVLVTVISCGTLGKILLLVPQTLNSADLEYLLPEWGAFL